MENIKFSKSKKIIIAVILAIVAVGIVGFLYYSQKQQTELFSFDFDEQARKKVCKTMKGQLFDEICQEKYDNVGKNNIEKIDEVYLFINKIGDSTDISDFERILLSQATFAALPTKDSQLATISKKYIAYAEEINNDSRINDEGVKEVMIEQLNEMINDIPKEDNAWVISLVISKHGWVNGERQPIYTETYLESFDPYPGVKIENKSEWEQYDYTHSQSRTFSFSTSLRTNTGPVQEGVIEKVAYSFNMMSWHSKPYGKESVLVLAEAGPPEEYLTSKRNLSEINYNGNLLLSDVLSVVEMPSRIQSNETQKKTVPPPGTPIESSDAEFICETPGCEACISDPMVGLYCFENLGRIEELVGAEAGSGDEFNLAIIDLLKDVEPTYRYTDVMDVPDSVPE